MMLYMWKIPIRNYVEKIKTGEIVLAVPPLSDTIGPSFSLGIITSVATLNRVKRAKATKADHPLFLQLFEEGKVIFLFSIEIYDIIVSFDLPTHPREIRT